MQQYWQWKQVCKIKHQPAESFIGVFLHITLVLPYSKRIFLNWTEHCDAKRWLAKYSQLFKSIGEVEQLAILPVFYKQMLLPRQVLSQEGVLKAECYVPSWQ